MPVRSRCVLSAFIAAVSIAVLSCSSGPKGPVAGSPAFYWASAGETFRNGDYTKTANNLSKLLNNTEYAARAQPWEMIVNAGLAQGYMELADRFDAGGRANRWTSPGFRAQVSRYRSAANSAALQYTESIHAFMAKNKDESVALAFPFPASGTASEPVQAARVTKGVLPPEAEILSIEKGMLQRGVLLAVANVVGAPNDPAKAREIFSKGEVKIPRVDFLRAAARSLHEQSQLYVTSKLDHPQRMKLLCTEAKEALDAAKPANKEDVALRKKIDDLMKKYKLTS
jgi:hypothetical protein